MRTPQRLLPSVILATLLAACGGGIGPEAADNELDVVLSSVTERAEPTLADGRDVEAVADATAAFAVDLYQRVAADEADNVVLGPYSAWMALTMTSMGAAGSTRDEMAAALRFPFEEDRLLTAVNALDRVLTNRAADDAARFNVANRLWGQRGEQFVPSFLDSMVKHFGAPLVAADFASRPEEGRADINRWVKRRTSGRIPELFPSGTIDARTSLVLVNAIHLDAPWEFGFDPDDTVRGPFARADGSTVDAQLMHYDEFLPSALDDSWKAVELPYKGGGLSMVVVVPNDFAAFEADLDQGRLDEILGRLKHGGIHLVMPRFTFSTHASLVGPLEAMGVASAFSGAADFTRLTEGGGLSIGAVEHEAFIRVDEEGTEAAAASGVQMPVSHGPTIEVTRPFLFLIRDQSTNAIVFIGRVLDPSAKSAAP